MELHEQMTLIVAGMLANPNCTKSVDDMAATAALIVDEINSYPNELEIAILARESNVPEIPPAD